LRSFDSGLSAFAQDDTLFGKCCWARMTMARATLADTEAVTTIGRDHHNPSVPRTGTRPVPTTLCTWTPASPVDLTGKLVPIFPCREPPRHVHFAWMQPLHFMVSTIAPSVRAQPSGNTDCFRVSSSALAHIRLHHVQPIARW